MPDDPSAITAVTSNDNEAACVIVDRRAGVATVALNRPDRGNALTSEIVERLQRAVVDSIAC